jgi:hypothetical protein
MSYLTTSYKAFMETSNEFSRLEKFVGASLMDRRRADLYRSRRRFFPLIVLLDFMKQGKRKSSAAQIFRMLNETGQAHVLHGISK